MTEPTSPLIDRLPLDAFRSPRTGQRPLGSARLLLVSASLFALLALSVALGNPLTPIDQALTAALQQLRSAQLDRWMTGLTLLGNSDHIALLSLALGLRLIHERNRTAALHWLGAMAVLVVLNTLLKHGLAIPRPNILLQPLSSFGFPSGHSSASTLFFSLLAAFSTQQQPLSRRWRVYSLAALAALGVGVSRLYLGVHWFSDVLGGILLGLAIAAATCLLYSRFDRRPLTFDRPGFWLTGLTISAIYIGIRLGGAVLVYLPARG
ncbi:MAG: membrane-associated phospholipid phosphatase [Motiliproteus sp.]|jgi:membrane-associated phospholipid phosphatase